MIQTISNNLMAIIIGLALMAAMYYAGFVNGRSGQVVKQVRADNRALLKWAETADSISRAFTALAQASTRERVEIQYKTKVITNEVIKYVEQIPEEHLACYVLPEPVFELRLCAIDELYKAARAELPPERVGASCPTGLPYN